MNRFSFINVADNLTFNIPESKVKDTIWVETRGEKILGKFIFNKNDIFKKDIKKEDSENLINYIGSQLNSMSVDKDHYKVIREALNLYLCQPNIFEMVQNSTDVVLYFLRNEKAFANYYVDSIKILSNFIPFNI